jgi:arginyl-tRNA synthetase
MNLLKQVQQPFRTALGGLVADPEPYVAMVRTTQDARHGDYQANCAMALAKVLGRPPREVAQEIAAQLPQEGMLEEPEIAGPGFINVRLRSDWLAAQVQAMAQSERLGVEPAAVPNTIVIDYSSPNVAKPLHVGHLRSTIIGDALARLFRFLGHKVITDNHLGDWGTQFGILLYGWKNFGDEKALQADPVQELLRLYMHVRKLMATDAEDADDVANPVAEAARQETAKLHEGDPENVALWQRIMPWCVAELEEIYRQLDIHFDYTLGESYYNPVLPDVVRSLEERGLAQPGREGALIIEFGEDQPPALVRKKDGAFTYMTTDLATIRHRVETWKADVILYIVDFRQGQHFKNLFDAARRWGYDKVALEHVSFGSVLGKDRKPIKTREGGAVELSRLLNEAVRRAEQVYQRLCQEQLEGGHEVPELSPGELCEVYEVVGLGAVKYADLSQNRTSDYIFDFDKMLAMDGNTATYMQYAYVRNRGIFRKGQVDVTPLRTNPPLPQLQTPEERNLALWLLRFQDALESAAAEYKPNAITAYLWDLAKAYSGFFTNCPVLKAATPELRQSRLLLCDLTARVIQQGLQLLGIRTVERM